MMGNATEAFNAAWYSKQTGDSVTARNELRKHNTIEYMACNLDGLCLGETAVWEAKHTSDYDFGEREAKTIESLGQYYLPQLTHNMLVLGLEQARLSAFFGNGRWDYLTVELDPFYADALLEAEAKFWQCVKSDTPPVDLPAPPPPPAVDKMRIVDMEAAKSNAWAASASDFLVHKSAAKIFEDSKTNLKKLVDKDVKEAYGYGVRITRAKNGALTVKEDK
jgi:predicted phage-related endonuclease